MSSDLSLATPALPITGRYQPTSHPSDRGRSTFRTALPGSGRCFIVKVQLSSPSEASVTLHVVVVWRYVEIGSNVGGGWQSAAVGGGAAQPGGGEAAKGKDIPGETGTGSNRCCFGWCHRVTGRRTEKVAVLQPHDPTSYVRLNRTLQPLDSRLLVARQHFRNTMLRKGKYNCCCRWFLEMILFITSAIKTRQKSFIYFWLWHFGDNSTRVTAQSTDEIAPTRSRGVNFTHF